MMAEPGERDDVSDGSDFELDLDDDVLGEDEELVAIRDVRVYDELNDLARQIFGDSEEDDDDDFAGFQDGWQRDNFLPRVKRNYRRQQGLNVALPQNPKAVDYFQLFWDQSMWDRLVTETNHYAGQQRAANPPPPNVRWSEVDEGDMKTFIALCLMMGIIRLPTRNDYWRTKEDCWLAHTNFGKAMSRDRFGSIWRYLHLQDSATPVPGDKLTKLRWFMNHLVNKYQTVYTPGPTYTVDETMVKFKGRLGFRQYLPMKPTKWGIKIWSLAESTTGYIVNCQVYTGRDGGRTEHGLAHRVVMDMCVPLQGTQSEVYFDNFFTSCRLLEDLKALSIQGCGTVRANRKGLPQDLVPKKGRPALQKHESKVAQNNDLVFCHWQDTKPVLVLSNFHDPQEQGQVRRNGGGQGRRYVAVPACLADYQKHMKGVDLADQMVGYYTLNHRSWKWWRRLFFHQMLVSMHNAYVIAYKNEPDRAKQDWPHFQDFVEAVAHSLVTTRVTRAVRPADAPARATLDHKVDKIYETRKTCQECSRRAPPNERRRTTKYGCVQCQVPCHQECLINHLRHHNVVHNN